MQCVLADQVLVLNKYYQPINIISVKRALVKLIKQIAEVVTIEDDQYCNYTFNSWAELSQIKKELEEIGQFDEFLIDTENLKFVVPRVIRVLNYDKIPNRTVKLNRRNIYLRDNNTCQYCGKQLPSSKLNIDHVIPRCQNGQNLWTNLVCSCLECNDRKAGRTPKEAKMKLIREPKELKFNPSLRVSIHHQKYVTWKYFVSCAYWNAELTE